LVVDLGKVGLALVFAGFLTAVIGVAAVAIYTAFRGVSEVGYGGCVLIMFIPICFGAGSPGIVPYLILVSTAVMLLAVVIVYYLLRSVAKSLATSTYRT